ncbi:hypothetical protein EMCRGX_G014134 [Ephydatia muelleri]
MHLWAKLPLNTNSSSMSLQWNASLQPDYVITAYTLHHRVPSLKSQSEMWAPPSTATVQFHTYNPSGILFYQINSVMTDILEVKLHGGLPWLMFAQCGLWTSCRWIQQYQNLQRWSVAHCELQNSSAVELVRRCECCAVPSCNLCDGQGYVVLFEQASNTFYVTVDTVHAAAITAVIVPLLTMKHMSYPLLNAPDEFDAVSVQNVGSTYIIVSWDLPTDSNGILINFSLYCNGALAGVLPLTVISFNTTGLLPFTLYMYITLSVGQVLQSHPQALHSNWNVVLGVISAAASLPRPYGGAYSRSPIPQLEQDTLKSMLRKFATQKEKDWDKLIPYVLFAYREVPQRSTGFSPFELLYGREVRGPLDVLRESWVARERNTESVVSHVLAIRERMEQMSSLVRESLEKAQQSQKAWYDQTARDRTLNEGDLVLVLLPTSSNTLIAQWQGPYKVTKQTSYWSESGTDVDEDDEIPVWKEESAGVVHYGPQLTEQQRKDLDSLMSEFAQVLANTPGRTQFAEHCIETGSARPVRLPAYRIPHAYRETVRQEIEEMLEEGIIEHSNSEWSSPIVLVGKKDGSLRLCVDYRRLNSLSEADAYPMPRIDEMLDQLGTARFISTLDLTRGYWQVPVAKEARHKTAFVTPFGLYHFNVMPFGLQGAPATFQRLMDGVIRGLEGRCAAYLDDLIIFSHSWAEHLVHIREVLSRLQGAGLTAKPSKCHFGMLECTYLGHVVGKGVVQPEPSKVQAVMNFPIPSTKTQVRGFLGLTGYYRRFIPNYAAMVAILTDLTKKSASVQVQWSEQCNYVFEELKRILCCSPVLRSPDFKKPFVLQTDASDRGVGAVLSQKNEAGDDNPIAYFSKKLQPREERYSTIEKECLAIKLAMQAFRTYLIGRHFTVETDHRSLVWMDKLKDSNSRLTRWSLSMQPFNFTVVHRAGQANGNADALSRAPGSSCASNKFAAGEEGKDVRDRSWDLPVTS